MNKSEDRSRENDNPYASPRSEPVPPNEMVAAVPRKKWQPGWTALFAIVALLSLIPPLTAASIVCAILGFSFLRLAGLVKSKSPDATKSMQSVASIILLVPGLLLTGAVMFGGTCTAVAWPTMLIAEPYFSGYGSISFGMVTGATAGLAMGLFWIYWLFKGGPDSSDSLFPPD